MFKKILLSAFIICILLLAAGVFFVSTYESRKPAHTAQTPKVEDAKFTIIEGWNIQDIADALANGKVKSGPRVARADFLKILSAKDTTSYPLVNSRPKGATLEGFLFPDTYFLPASSTLIAETLIEKALANFEKKFTPEMEAQAAKGNMSVFEIVTLASIVEKETGRNAVTDEQKQALDEERKIIAGIFYNRLNAGMPLQSDATINYVTGKNDPAASEQDIQVNSPYNTYKNPGLPPGPIANPSLSSILAVLYPTKTDYFYFLHKQPSGEPVYSKTFEEHVANKQKYLK